jgi:GPI transamidase subunit PIG-U
VLFAGHPYLHALPLLLRLRAQPSVLASALVATWSVWGSPPTLGALVLCTCLALQHPRVGARARLTAALAVGLGTPLAALLAVLHLWLSAGTGNANFLFFQGLTYNVGLCMGVLHFIGKQLVSCFIVYC